MIVVYKLYRNCQVCAIKGVRSEDSTVKLENKMAAKPTVPIPLSKLKGFIIATFFVFWRLADMLWRSLPYKVSFYFFARGLQHLS